MSTKLCTTMFIISKNSPDDMDYKLLYLVNVILVNNKEE